MPAQWLEDERRDHMYNEIREAVGTHRSDTEKLIRHIDNLVRSGTETRLGLYLFVREYLDGGPVPTDIQLYIHALYTEGSVKQ